MNESTASPGVALLFADADLGAHLRESLVALGARIVYEGAAAQVGPGTLAESGADVVVVNLEPDEDEHFERLCAILEQNAHRVVFNDPEASRVLSGWDKARWARHLAVKLVGGGDVDPPRPLDARQVESGYVEASSGQVATAADEVDAVPGGADAPQAADVPEDAASLDVDSAQSEQMSAELEAMLADGEAGAADAANDAGDGDSGSAPEPVLDVEERRTESVPAPVSDWELVDVDAEPPAPVEQEDASRFGIEKVDAADYLKPDGEEAHDSPIEPGSRLELVSLEESVAPFVVGDEPVSEMVLDADATAIQHVVLVGAGPDAASELGEFLAGLSGTLPALVVIVQHRQESPAEDMAGALGTSTRLPVRVADDGAVARRGEAWLVPAGQSCRIDRHGRISLEAHAPETEGSPSIDRCFEILADAFGAGATAIVLAADGPDGLAGAQHVVEQGGRVWIREPEPAAGGTALAARIRENGLDSFSGSPAELAQHLVEDIA